MRLFILFLILGVLVAIIVISSLQIGWHYLNNNLPNDDIKFDENNSKEQIISDLTAENDRLASELDDLRSQLPTEKKQK